MTVDTNELRRKVNSTDIVDHIDLHANIKPFLSELIDRLEAAEKAVTEAYQRGYATGQEELEKEADALRTELKEVRHGVAVAHDTIKALRTKIEQMERQEPVATVIKEGDCRYWMSERLWTFQDGKYPLYALPCAQSGPSVPEVTDAMAMAFHHALTDGSIGAREVEEIKDALRAALAAAPEAKPCP